ncbi:mid1-interacting protein 1A-like [Mytilus trossulus]|uniref:mid1-interacting protein 1A-like n=1 Tax=Mytilus trossulus TaxID=6551 RepID=UPI0030063853
MQNDKDKSSDVKSSLLDSLKKFVGAVEAMNETVMIPSRLKDMEISASSKPVITENNNNETCSSLPDIEPGTSMYSFYKVLNKLEKEIVSGQSAEVDDGDFTDSSDDNSDNSDDSANISATNFKYHLRGLFNSLNQMTATAKVLTDTYETEVGQCTRHAHFSSFAV